VPETGDEQKKKRGAPEIPLKWTRVFKITTSLAPDQNVFEIEKDQQAF
jgi:hypothetical protein